MSYYVFESHLWVPDERIEDAAKVIAAVKLARDNEARLLDEAAENVYDIFGDLLRVDANVSGCGLSRTQADTIGVITIADVEQKQENGLNIPNYFDFAATLEVPHGYSHNPFDGHVAASGLPYKTGYFDNSIEPAYHLTLGEKKASGKYDLTTVMFTFPDDEAEQAAFPPEYEAMITYPFDADNKLTVSGLRNFIEACRQQ